MNRVASRSGVLVAVSLIILLTGCADDAATTTPPSAATSSTTSATMVTSTTAATSTTTSVVAAMPSVTSFSIPVGESGVTFDVDGDPPSGPSSFAVRSEGLVVADTLAANRGEPRLLFYDNSGELDRIVDLSDIEVAAIVDVVSNGSDLAVLDIDVSRNRYRLVRLSSAGEVESTVDIPAGFHLEDGLTGLLWDDVGVLLEIEFGAFFARIDGGGIVEPGAIPVFDGEEVSVAAAEGRSSLVTVGDLSWTVERATDLGSATLIGVAGSNVAIVIDEVDTSGSAFSVLRRVQRYTREGVLLDEVELDAGEQYVEIMRSLELAPDGAVIYLLAQPTGLNVIPLSSAGR